MRRLVIHGGIHRTGTTSLQGTLANNRELLKSNGFEYPGDKANHQPWVWGLFSKKISADNFLEFLDSCESPNIIVSGEDFCIHKNLDWLNVVSRKFRIEVHFFLRRQDDWLTSWYNQHLKWPFDRRKSKMNSMDFLNTLPDYYWLDYHWLASRWAEKLGDNNVYLYRSDTDNLGKFSAAVLPEINLVAGPRKNDSMPFEALEIVRHLSLMDLKHHARTRIIEALRTVYQNGQHQPQIYPINIRQMIVDRYEASNSIVCKKYFAGEPFLFQPISGDDKYYTPKLPDSENLLREVIAPMLKGMFGT